MNILRVDFRELYRRHLCRHGQFGINFWHILAVYGIYFSICSLTAVTVRTLLHVIMIPVWHRVQLISHRRYTLHRDMSAFDLWYRKGRTLFLLLAVYELPILLHYLAFGRKDWVR